MFGMFYKPNATECLCRCGIRLEFSTNSLFLSFSESSRSLWKLWFCLIIWKNLINYGKNGSFVGKHVHFAFGSGSNKWVVKICASNCYCDRTVCVCVTENDSIEFRRLILDERPLTVMHYLYGCTSIASHKLVFAAICLKCVFPMSEWRSKVLFYLFFVRPSKIDSYRTPYFTCKVWLNENGNVLLSCLSHGLPTKKPPLSGYFTLFPLFLSILCWLWCSKQFYRFVYTHQLCREVTDTDIALRKHFTLIKYTHTHCTENSTCLRGRTDDGIKGIIKASEKENSNKTSFILTYAWMCTQ